MPLQYANCRSVWHGLCKHAMQSSHQTAWAFCLRLTSRLTLTTPWPMASRYSCLEEPEPPWKTKKTGLDSLAPMASLTWA